MKKYFVLMMIFAACLFFTVYCDSKNKQDDKENGDPIPEVQVTHLAGSFGGHDFIDGTGTAARFYEPFGITTDGTYLYVADAGNKSIRRIVVSTGEVTTLPGLPGVAGITTDGTYLYVTGGDNSPIRRVVIATGQITTLADYTDGFSYPSGITTDGTYLYIADTGNQMIRRIVIATGQITTIAGAAGPGGITDGIGTTARFKWPEGITTDGTYIYVADTGNHTIRRIVIATGEVTTLAGSPGNDGSADGTGTAARFYNPTGITTDGTYLYVSDTWNHTIRRVVIATGEVTTMAGLAGADGTTDSTGTTARFYEPRGIINNGAYLYVADTCNHTIRRVAIATNQVTTIAGLAVSAGATNGIGPTARFNDPNSITSYGSYLYVADTSNNTIRRIVIASGEVTTLAGMAGVDGSADGTGAAASFYNPQGITTDGTYLYVADTGNHTIRQIVITTGEVTTLAGMALGQGATDGIGSAAWFNNPCGITTDGTYLYVADTGNHTIRQIVIATGEVTTLAGSAGFYGSTDGHGTSAMFFKPEGITTDGTYIYVADTWNFTIRSIEISTGEVSTLAGLADETGTADGTGSSARFCYSEGITTDGTYLYVADTWNSTIRRITIATGKVITIAGSADEFDGSSDGNGTEARFYYPRGITIEGSSLFVSDTGNQCIREIEL